jgi:crossover junction endodeoxyribonuclease RusA
MQLELEYPPSANRYWRMYRGHMVVSDEARTYKESAYWSAKRQGATCTKLPVAVSLHIRKPANRRDMDNHLKILLDSLQGAAYENDSQVVELHVTVEVNKKNPGVSVKIDEVK